MSFPRIKLNLEVSFAGALGWALTCFLFWLSLSWGWDVQHLITGIVCVFFLGIIWKEFLPRSYLPLSAFPLLALYLLTLAWEVLKANFEVALIVLSPRLPIKPAFVCARVPVSSPVGQVALANSITLTPGTLTVDVANDAFLIHVLNGNKRVNLAEWPLTRLIRSLEGKTKA